MPPKRNPSEISDLESGPPEIPAEEIVFDEKKRFFG